MKMTDIEKNIMENAITLQLEEFHHNHNPFFIRDLPPASPMLLAMLFKYLIEEKYPGKEIKIASNEEYLYKFNHEMKYWEQMSEIDLQSLLIDIFNEANPVFKYYLNGAIVDNIYRLMISLTDVKIEFSPMYKIEGLQVINVEGSLISIYTGKKIDWKDSYMYQAPFQYYFTNTHLDDIDSLTKLTNDEIEYFISRVESDSENFSELDLHSYIENLQDFSMYDIDDEDDYDNE